MVTLIPILFLILFLVLLIIVLITTVTSPGKWQKRHGHEDPFGEPEGNALRTDPDLPAAGRNDRQQHGSAHREHTGEKRGIHHHQHGQSSGESSHHSGYHHSSHDVGGGGHHG